MRVRLFAMATLLALLTVVVALPLAAQAKHDVSL